MRYVIRKLNDPHESRAKQVADLFLCKFQIRALLRGYLWLKPLEKRLFFAYRQAACDWEWRRHLFGTGRARRDYSGVKRWEGKHGAPPKFPKGQFTVMDGYTVAVKFLLCGPDREGRGMLSDSREHLSRLEFSFSVPTRLMIGQGLFFWVCGGKHGVSAIWVVKLRPCVFQTVCRFEEVGTAAYSRFIWFPSSVSAKTFLNFTWIWLSLFFDVCVVVLLVCAVQTRTCFLF